MGLRTPGVISRPTRTPGVISPGGGREMTPGVLRREFAELRVRKVGAKLPELRLEVRVDFALLCRREQLGRATLSSFPNHCASLTPRDQFSHVELVIDTLHVVEGRESIHLVDERLRCSDTEERGNR